MNASDSFDEREIDVVLDIVSPLIDPRYWFVKWRIFQLCRVGVARGELAVPMPLRELAGLTGQTHGWLSKVLRRMVEDDRVLFRDPPYPQKPGSRPAMFAINPAIADWRGVPWSIAREHVLARLGYRRARDRWVLSRSYVRDTNELSGALLYARHNRNVVSRSGRRGSATQPRGSGRLLQRDTNLNSGAAFERDTNARGASAPPSYGVSKETLSRERHDFDNANRGDGERDEEVFGAVHAVTGSPVWPGSNPERRLVATVRRDGPDAVLSRIHELGRRGMHPAELVGVVAAGSTPHVDRPEQLEKRLQSLRRVIATQELTLEQRVEAGYPVDEEEAELEGYRAEAAQLAAELGLEINDRFGGRRDNDRTDDAMEVHA